MDGGIASSSPESLAGILKTIFLFLENQNFTETCGTLIKESQSKQIPHIKEALARLVVLRPSIAEIVRIAHADPKNTDSQVQADFPLSHSANSCVLEGSVYAMPENRPSSKHVSLFVTDSNYCTNVKDGKIRIASAPSLGVQACYCAKGDGVASKSNQKPPRPDDSKSPKKKTTKDDLTDKSSEEERQKPTEEYDIDKKSTEDQSLNEQPTHEDVFVEEMPSPTEARDSPTGAGLKQQPTEDAESATLGDESDICHASCTAECADRTSKDCVILKQAYDYIIVQQSCPFSCTGACSQGVSVCTDESDVEVPPSKDDDKVDQVPIQVIHERPHEISEAITPLESTEHLEQGVQESVEIVDAATGEPVPSSEAPEEEHASSGKSDDAPVEQRSEDNVELAERSEGSSKRSVQQSPSLKSPGEESSKRSVQQSPSLKSPGEESSKRSVQQSPSLKSPGEESSKRSVQQSPSLKSPGEESSKRSVQQSPSLKSPGEGSSRRSFQKSPSLKSPGEGSSKRSFQKSPSLRSPGKGSKTSEVLSTSEKDQQRSFTAREDVEAILMSIERHIFSISEKSDGSFEPAEEHFLPTKPHTSSASIKELFREPRFEEVSRRSSMSADVGGKEQVPLEPRTYMETLPKKELAEVLCLDYGKVKKQLQEGDPETSRKLLRALRWRLISSKQEARNNVMVEYSRVDVLGLHGHPSRSVAEELLCPAKQNTPNQLQEGMARFINAMASLILGREYLCKKEHFLAKVLIPLLLQQDNKKCSLSDVTRCHLLVTLQKLSLRNKMRLTMISAGLPEYTVSFLLAKHNELSQYCLEYTTALFMNLCLHKEARDQLKSNLDKVVELIIAFLDSDHDECLPYMNGAMYSVFIEPSIRAKAVEQKLNVKIEEKINGKSEEITQQMQIIQNILNLHPSETYCTDCDCLDQDEEVEHLEPEVDAGDDLNAHEAEQILEQFRKCESCRGHGSYKFDCLRRPVTPLQKISFSTPCKSCNYSLCLDEPLEEVEDENRVEPKQTVKKEKGKKRTSGGFQPSKPKAKKTVDTLYKAEKPGQQESKMDSELNYLLAAKQAISARQPKAKSRRTSPRPSFTTKTNGGRSPTTAELNSVYFQHRHFSRESSNYPCSFTRPCINAQDRTSFRADQARAFRPCMTQTSHSRQLQNRYRCDCFEEMRALIDQLGTGRPRCCHRNRPNLFSRLAKLEEPETPVYVQPSYNELLHSLRKNLCVTEYCTSEANCTVHCECYNLVFQSRPKVTRTP